MRGRCVKKIATSQVHAISSRSAIEQVPPPIGCCSAAEAKAWYHGRQAVHAKSWNRKLIVAPPDALSK